MKAISTLFFIVVLYAPLALNGQVKDIDGNTYGTVKIGTQEWLNENLNVSKFKNGDLIPEAKSVEEWKTFGLDGKPAWCYSNFNPENGKRYGKLYNWFAVADPRGLAPEGCHVPTLDEWEVMTKNLGDNAGSKLKSKDGWYDNGNGTNESTFNAIPSGYTQGELGEYAYWWTSTKNKDYNSGAYIFFLGYDMFYIDFRTYSWDSGLSVRCVKN